MTSLRVSLNYTPARHGKSFMSLAPLVGTLSEGWVITRHTLLVMNKTWLHARFGNFCDIPFSGRPASSSSVLACTAPCRQRQPGCSLEVQQRFQFSNHFQQCEIGVSSRECPTITSEGKARMSLTARSRN